MVLRGNGEVKSKSSQKEATSHSKVESSREHSHYEGDFLMLRRLMRKLCSIIIDGGSSANVASARLVGKLGVPTLPHHFLAIPS
ncbi:hypothetical protein CR513_54131, partial [Mucuna pruriens]